MGLPSRHSTSYASDATPDPQAEVFGSLEPRLSTPPLRELTPETSYGFDVIDFARDVLGEPLRPWQEHAVIRIGELLPDGRPRFRTVLVLVARQNGKTYLAKVLILYWMFAEMNELTLFTSTDRKYAKRGWLQIIEQARQCEWLSPELGPGAVRLTPGEESFSNVHGAELIFAANNNRAARSTTLHRWLCDEIRQHLGTDTWASATNAMNAVSHAQVVAVSNQGDDEAVLLDQLRTAAHDFIETGVGDYRLGLLEWSAPDGAEPTDEHALAAANPSYGTGIDRDALRGAAARAVAAGGQELADFRTEVLCQRVDRLNPAIDEAAWRRTTTDNPLSLAEHRDRVALCMDISIDETHASLVAAALIDGTIHVETVKAWAGQGCVADLRRELPALVARVRPRALGWYPAGPAASVAADMAASRVRGWPPRGVVLEELKAETTAVCMALPMLIASDEIRHPDDPMLNQHVAGASRLSRGDGFVFARRGRSSVDAVYAMAGAVHLARTLPPPRPPLVAL